MTDSWDFQTAGIWEMEKQPAMHSEIEGLSEGAEKPGDK